MGKAITGLTQPAVVTLPAHHAGMNRSEIIACHPLVNRIDMRLKLCFGLFNASHAVGEHSADELMVRGGITRPRPFGELRKEIDLLLVGEIVCAQTTIERIGSIDVG